MSGETDDKLAHEQRLAALGRLGAGIAHVSALAGIEVVLLDSTLELAEKGKAYSRQLLAKEVERGRRSQADADAVLARIKTTTSYDDLAGCDLVVEAVFENRDIKADVIKKCAEGDEGKALLEAEFKIANGLGIGASPTWLANNKFKFSGIDAETVRKNLCDHSKDLKGCENKLTGQTGAPVQGGCGN